MKMFRVAAGAAIILACVANGYAQQRHIAFDDFVQEYSQALLSSERGELLNRFWTYAALRGFPYVEENQTEVVFLYRGPDSVRVVGDFTSWSFRIPLKRLPESDVWYVKLTFEPDARLDYKFFSPSKGTFLDPLNPRTSEGGFGKSSELRMPQWASAPEAEPQAGVRSGSLVTATLPSKILDYDHQLTLYLPPQYDVRKTEYPVVYFNDGGDYLAYVKASTILDNLLNRKQIQPLIGVFIHPPVETDRNRRTEYGLNRAYEKFVATELVPFVDKTYRTLQQPRQRLIVGASYGGLSALSTGLNYPDVFGNVGSHSAYASFKRDTLLSLYRQKPHQQLSIYLTVGTYERNITNNLSAGETDFLKANRELRSVLEQKGYAVKYREYRDGHSTAQWRNDLPQMLRWFFPAE